MIDYRRLLRAYMGLVMGNEGTSFLEYSPPFRTEFDELSDDEVNELRRIKAEARNYDDGAK